MRKTKIVCTIGPSSESLENTKKLIMAGMNVARLNFSHGDFEEHGNRIKNIRQACKELGKTVAILLDTKGPEIRLGKLAEEPIELVQDDYIVLTTEEILGDRNRIPVTYANLPQDVKVGSTILIDDGLIGLTVVDVQGTEIKCRIVNSGPIKSKKGVNVPGVHISLPGITEKDANDIVFGIEQGIDFIAASFVRKASDVLEIRELLERHNASHIQIISKIENQQGVDNLDDILELSDGLMVARGDLGVEIPAEEVPLVQKTMIEKCNRAGKPVITATQMLDSMQRNPRPTRAEASDVANAIFDGTDAIMLSGETAAGKYPVESVLTMSRIAERAESALHYREIFTKQANAQQTSVTEAISQAVANSALDLNASAIITSTESGYTARMISKYRPKSPIIAVTPIEQVMRKLQLVWGVIPAHGTAASTTDEMFDIAVNGAFGTGLVRLGDTVVITAGVPVGRSGTTNLIKIHTVGDLVAKGQGIGSQAATGKVVVARTPEEAIAKSMKGSILVTPSTDREYMPAIEKAAAIITEQGGITSHAAVVGLNVGIPVILGVQNATELLKDGMEVTLYAEHGFIYTGQASVL
ncbi:pyruvate kinase [Paenibacillus darwinianus]|uniref:Pyruvate kinase n=1 Tax=Paenibacillus darwinianus TaxID=1380763 RepID=A0A9W5S2B3_9BACL|nr:pyruvate kinase [Paenibacillus darwinianus]EXX89388.1 pyruvate kinase [Paenibacillus darwinianus]EXX91600.1 pyruvate kinase [Paenibacillus darwinianus]EXX92461.1 pyruvate kinase [Paenibacillus darwinianus]